ncbi:hypothetical protein HDU67_000170 [Dinochytrium kinnereticum]|nr:hypothetical protein HDU67_000170 [Dinochytrium kinnereticum]
MAKVGPSPSPSPAVSASTISLMSASGLVFDVVDEAKLAADQDLTKGFLTTVRELYKEDNVDSFNDIELLKFLLANKNHIGKAMSALSETLAWRKTFGTDTTLLDGEDFSDLDATGKAQFFGRARDGTPILVVNLSRHSTPKDVAAREREIRYMIYVIEKARRDGVLVDKMTVIVDRANVASGQADSAMIKTVVPILQKHYPERLARMFDRYGGTKKDPYDEVKTPPVPIGDAVTVTKELLTLSPPASPDKDSSPSTETEKSTPLDSPKANNATANAQTRNGIAHSPPTGPTATPANPVTVTTHINSAAHVSSVFSSLTSARSFQNLRTTASPASTTGSALGVSTFHGSEPHQQGLHPGAFNLVCEEIWSAPSEIDLELAGFCGAGGDAAKSVPKGVPSATSSKHFYGIGVRKAAGSSSSSSGTPTAMKQGSGSTSADTGKAPVPSIQTSEADTTTASSLAREALAASPSPVSFTSSSSLSDALNDSVVMTSATEDVNGVEKKEDERDLVPSITNYVAEVPVRRGHMKEETTESEIAEILDHDLA